MYEQKIVLKLFSLALPCYFLYLTGECFVTHSLLSSVNNPIIVISLLIYCIFLVFPLVIRCYFKLFLSIKNNINLIFAGRDPTQLAFIQASFANFLRKVSLSDAASSWELKCP